MLNRKRRGSALALMIAAALWTTSAQASRVLTDETGRKVTVPDHPQRVICLAPSVTDTAFALGADEDIVAVSDYTTYPPAAVKKPSIGSLIKPSIETILSFHPDLVLGTSIPTSTETAAQLQAVGVPVYFVDPHGIAGILRSIDSLGAALHREAQAATLKASIIQRIELVKARAAGKPTPRVLLPVWYDPLVTIGKHAFITEIIETAGAKSVTDDFPSEWPQVSLEIIIARAPDALVLFRGGKISVDTLQKRPGWSSLAAVQNNRVYYVDGGIQEPSPVAINALEELAREFHP
jgi:ABC-type Fe3+-hydroxamate transport system substrate-binding protein